MSNVLRNWIREQGITVAQLADRLGKPRKTIEDWVYRGKMPSKSNRTLVYSVTGLAEFQPQVEELARPKAAKAKPPPVPSLDEAGIRQLFELLIRDLKGHINVAEEILHFFAVASPSVRDRLRSRLDPKRVAHFSGLLRAILSEERLREFRVAEQVSNSLRQGEIGGRHGRSSESSDGR